MCQRLPPPPATVPRLSSHRAATATAPPLRTWERLSPRPAAKNGSRGPARTPAAPRSIFEPAVLGGHNNRDVGIHRPPPREPSSPSRRRLRSPRCELHRDPLSLSPCCLFPVSCPLAPNPRAPSTSLPPAMAATSPAAFPGRALGLSEFPFTPATPRCARIFVW